MSVMKWFCCRDVFGETEKGLDSIIPVKKKSAECKKNLITPESSITT